jgi:hypothetical protein
MTSSKATMRWRRRAWLVDETTPVCPSGRTCAGGTGPADSRWSLWLGVAAGAAIWFFGARPTSAGRVAILVAVAAFALIVSRRAGARAD